MKKSFGDRLKEKRGDRSQGEISSVFGVSQSAYSAWERGAKEPSISTICSICKKYDVSADWLLGLSDKESEHIASKTDAASGESEVYWRDLVASQQATIVRLTELLSEGRTVATPAKTGGHTATKTA